MPAYRLLRAILIGLAVLFVSAAYAQTQLWPSTPTYSNWPTTWVPLPGLDDPRDDTAQKYNPSLDIVGNGGTTDPTANAGYVNWDSSYLYFRMRLDAPVTDSFGDMLYVLIDAPTADGVPDWAISFTLDPGVYPPNANWGGGLDLLSLEPRPAQNKWLWQTYTWQSNVTDGYVRATTGLADIGFGTDDCYVDYAISWNFLQAETGLRLGDRIGFQIATGGHPYDPRGGPGNKNNLYDIGGGETATNNEQFNTEPPHNLEYITNPEPASMALTLLVLGIAGGAVRRRKARAEADADPLA